MIEEDKHEEEAKTTIKKNSRVIAQNQYDGKKFVGSL